MEKQLKFIQKLLANATITPDEIDKISLFQTNLRKELNDSLEAHAASSRHREELFNAISINTYQLEDNKKNSERIKSDAAELKANATKLQEANVEGALNLTRDALSRVRNLDRDIQDIESLNTDAERQCKRTESLILRNRDSTDDKAESNDANIKELNKKLNNLTDQIPNINEKMCGARGDPCDSLCGGAGCGRCGGLSCDSGALPKANKAIEFAKDSEKIIKEKEETADTLIRSLSQIKANASDVHHEAKESFAEAERFYNETQDLLADGEDKFKKLQAVVTNDTASPNKIRRIAEDTLKLDLQLDHDEIATLASQIEKTVASLENVEEIIENTQYDLDRVESLKKTAIDTKQRASDVLDTANEVVKALDEAEKAQKMALDAIKQAKTDIQLAESDLGLVSAFFIYFATFKNNLHVYVW